LKKNLNHLQLKIDVGELGDREVHLRNLEALQKDRERNHIDRNSVRRITLILVRSSTQKIILKEIGISRKRVKEMNN